MKQSLKYNSWFVMPMMGRATVFEKAMTGEVSSWLSNRVEPGKQRQLDFIARRSRAAAITALTFRRLRRLCTGPTLVQGELPECEASLSANGWGGCAK